MPSRGDAALARLRTLRSGFGAARLRDASERWRAALSSCAWRDSSSEHPTLARALENLASRADEAVRVKGTPARGGPARAEAAAALRAPGAIDAVAELVRSPAAAARRAACKALALLLGAVSSAAAVPPCPPLLVALAERAAAVPSSGADADAALAAAEALRALAGARARRADAAAALEADALAESDVASDVLARLETCAGRTVAPRSAAARAAADRSGGTGGGPISVSDVAPAAVAAAALATFPERARAAWTDPRPALRNDSLPSRVASTATAPARLARSLLAVGSRAAEERASFVAVAAFDAAATFAETARGSARREFRRAAAASTSSPAGGSRRAWALAAVDSGDAAVRAAAYRFIAVVEGGSGSESESESESEPESESPEGGDAFGAPAFASAVAADVARRPASAATRDATKAAAALLRPIRTLHGAAIPPPRKRRSALVDAGVADALAAALESPGAARARGPARDASGAAAATSDAFLAVARLANPGDPLALAPTLATTLADRALEALAAVGPPSTRRENKGFVGFQNSEDSSSVFARSSDDASTDASSRADRWIASAGSGAGDAAAEAVGARAGEALLALLERERSPGGSRAGSSSSGASAAASSAAASASADAAAEALGGAEWVRVVGRQLAAALAPTPAKALLAAALATRPTWRDALAGAGARERAAATVASLVERALRARAGADDAPGDDAPGGGGGLERARGGGGSTSIASDDDDTGGETRAMNPNGAPTDRDGKKDRALLVALLRALVELDPARVEGGAVRAALERALRVVASEDAEDAFGAEARCWAALAARLARLETIARHRSDAPLFVLGPRARVAADLAAALPAPFLGPRDEVNRRVDETAADLAARLADEVAALAAAAPPGSAGAPADVVFACADGARVPAHAAVLAARCPGLLPPSTSGGRGGRSRCLRAVRTRAGVDAASLRFVLLYAYAGALDAEACARLARADADAADLAALAALAFKCGARELAALARATRPRLGARLGSLCDDLGALLASADAEAAAASTRIDEGSTEGRAGPREVTETIPGGRSFFADVRLVADEVGGGVGEGPGATFLGPSSILAHAVVVSARSAFCRAALEFSRARDGAEPPTESVRDGAEPPTELVRDGAFAGSFAGSFAGTDPDDSDPDPGTPTAPTAPTGSDGSDGSDVATLRLPASSASALATLRAALYTGAIPEIPERLVDNHHRGDPAEDLSAEARAASKTNSWAPRVVVLAAGLAFLTLDEDAARCEALVRRELRRGDWRRRVGVAGAAAGLAAAVEARRWGEAEAFSDALADAYPAFEALGEAFDATPAELRETIRRAHVARRARG